MTSSSKGIALVAVIWIVAALAVLGGGVYFASTQSVDIDTDESAAYATTSASAENQVSLKDLFGKNVKCTFSTNQGNLVTKGIAYINGENLRVDAETMQGDKLVVTSHLIKVGTDAYAWSSMGAGAGQGAKLKVEAAMSAETKEKLSIDWDKKLNYECDEWAPETERLKIPTNITFVDVSAAFNAEAGAQTQVEKCKACDMISDATAKAQCKAALACK